MATVDELVLKPGDLRNVRLADYLGKRSGAFPHSWSLRYVVLAGNFLFVFATPQVRRACARARRAARAVRAPPARGWEAFARCTPGAERGAGAGAARAAARRGERRNAAGHHGNPARARAPPARAAPRRPRADT